MRDLGSCREKYIKEAVFAPNKMCADLINNLSNKIWSSDLTKSQIFNQLGIF